MLALATLPSAVRAAWLRTDERHQPKLAARLRAINALAQAPRGRIKATSEQLARELAHLGRGFSAKNLRTLFDLYREHGPEALLLDYGTKGEKPAEFITELARRTESNHRVASVELEALRAEWRACKVIPGYGTWQARWEKRFPGEPLPECCPEWFFPEGFGSRNLRRYLPGRAATTLARDGFFAAHALLPQKRNDYSQLRPLEMVVFDDVKTDWLVHYPGCKVPCELWLLVAMDVATRTILDWVALAAVPDDEGKRAQLLEQHMQLLAGALLQRYGIPTAYKMTWLVENNKATYRQAAKDALALLSGGQIAVQHTRMVNRALPSGHTERHGTPYDLKGVLESFFGNFHNHAAALPGQTGAVQMLDAPAQLAEQKREHAALLRECADLPPEVEAQLRLEFLRYSEAISALEKIFAHLNARTNHRLQGFDRVERWRFPEDPHWRPLDELRRYPRAEIARALFDHRMESPLERLEKLLAQHPAPTRVPAEALLPFSSRTIAKVRHPAPYTIAFTDGGTAWTYRGEIPELASGEGGPFLVKLLPGDVSTAYLHDAATGAWLGTLRHVAAPRVGDEAAQLAAVGEVQHYRSLVTAPVMARHAPARAAREENQRLNAALLASARTGQAMLAGAADNRRRAAEPDATAILNARAARTADDDPDA